MKLTKEETDKIILEHHGCSLGYTCKLYCEECFYMDENRDGRWKIEKCYFRNKKHGSKGMAFFIKNHIEMEYKIKFIKELIK